MTSSTYSFFKIVVIAGALFVSLFDSPAAFASESDPLLTFEEANRKFVDAESEKDFLEVASILRSIIDQGVSSGAIFFNLGNAYLRADRPGMAIAAYRQAERFLARDPQLQNNLDIALVEVGAPAKVLSVADRVLFWRSWLSYLEKGWVFLVMATVTFVLGLCWLRFGGGFRAASIASVVVTGLIGVVLVADVRDYDLTEHGVVTAREAVARKGNSESFAPAFKEPLGEGSEFTVEERRGEWARIRLPGDLEGWLPTEHISIY